MADFLQRGRISYALFFYSECLYLLHSLNFCNSFAKGLSGIANGTALSLEWNSCYLWLCIPWTCGCQEFAAGSQMATEIFDFPVFSQRRGGG